MRVFAFVGPSGSGKSYRATWVANEAGMECIIDDGLLIRGNELLAGYSAKKEPTKIGSIKRALFRGADHGASVRAAIKHFKPKSILILGTSDKMVEEIAKTLEIGQIERTIRIEDVATEEEIAKAKRIRQMQGKHVIPVPTFEIKKDFSGVLLDTLHIFNRSKRGKGEFKTTKSVVRPNFSYRGDYHIADNVIITICQIEASKIDGTGKNIRCVLESKVHGVCITLDISVKHGFDVRTVAGRVQAAVYDAVYKYTAVNVCRVNVNVKWLEL